MLGLQLLQQLGQQVSPEGYYTHHYKFKTRVLGLDVEYVFCPQTTLDYFHGDTKLGFSDTCHTPDNSDPSKDKMVFVSKNLKPAQVPYAALMLHLEAMDIPEIEAMLGENALKGLTHQQIRNLTTKIVFEEASKVLRPDDFAGLMNLYRTDRRYDSGVHEQMFNKISGKYVPATASSPNALAVWNTKSLEHYVRENSAYADAHHNNSWVKKSRRDSDIMEYIPKSRRILENWVSRADKVIKDIVEDTQIGNSLTEAMNVLTRWQAAFKGEEIALKSPTEARLAYLCSYDLKNSPLEFVNSPDPNLSVIRFKGNYRPFLESLQTRLAYRLFEELNDRKMAIEGVRQVVTEVSNGNRTLASIVRDYILPNAPEAKGINIALQPPSDVESAVSGRMKSDAESVAVAATSAPIGLRQTLAALRAYATLNEVGLPTDSVEAIIAGLQDEIAGGFARRAGLRQLNGA